MSLREQLPRLDVTGQALALIEWATGARRVTPFVPSVPGDPPTLTRAFFAGLPGTMQVALLADFHVDGPTQVHESRFASLQAMVSRIAPIRLPD